MSIRDAYDKMCEQERGGLCRQGGSSMSMPDRIWAHVRNLYGLMTPENSTWNTCERGTEYVRADIYEALRTRFEAVATAEVQRLKHLNDNAVRIVAEKDAEIKRLKARIEFLEKVADQAIELGQLKLSEQDAGSTPGFVLCDACMDDVPIEKAPELDAYLRERKQVVSSDNRPPDTVVQTVVQEDAG